MIPGMPGGAALSGGAGGVDLSAGPATSGAEGGQSSAGGQQFYFAPPSTAQKAPNVINSLSPMVWGGLGLVAVWLLSRR